MTFISMVITFILVIDPFGNIPIFHYCLENEPAPRRGLVILREMVIALVILSAALFLGRYMFKGLGITTPALTISGGIVLFLIALKMTFPREFAYKVHEEDQSPFIVPLAVPLIAGPTTIALLVLMSSRYPGETGKIFLALLAAWGGCLLILLGAEQFRKILGPRLIGAITRLMGIILTILAIQLLLNGIEEFVLHIGG